MNRDPAREFGLSLMMTACASPGGAGPLYQYQASPRKCGHPTREHGSPEVFSCEESEDLIRLLAVRMLDRHVDHRPLN